MTEKYSISNKKLSALYKSVNDEVMDARINIAKISGTDKVSKEIENILFMLSINAPQAAINQFKKNQPTMPITDNMRMQVIATYPNAPIMYNRDILQIHALRLQSNMIEVRSEKRGGGCIPVNKLKIKLRPISSLTDEECIEVARILYGDEFPASDWEYSNKHAPDWITLANADDDDYTIVFSSDEGIEAFLPNNQHAKYAQAIDYLRSINIITTVHGFDLVAEGIAIVNDKIGEI